MADISNGKKAIEEVRRELPNKLKSTANQRRLIELAKKAPFASANGDFLDLMEAKCTENEQLNKLAQMLVDAMDEIK